MTISGIKYVYLFHPLQQVSISAPQFGFFICLYLLYYWQEQGTVFIAIQPQHYRTLSFYPLTAGILWGITLDKRE
jgi:hypothetical protein